MAIVIGAMNGVEVKESSLIYLYSWSGTRALPRKMTHLVAVVAFVLPAFSSTGSLVAPVSPLALEALVLVPFLRALSGEVALLSAVVASSLGLACLYITHHLPEGQSLAMWPYPPQP